MVVVLDTSVLSWFARANRLDVLERLLTGIRAVTTRAVLDEIRNGIDRFPALQPVLHLAWLEEVSLNDLVVLGIFAEYSRRLGSGPNGNVGEATVLAWAEVNGAVPIVDEKAGRQVAKERRIQVRGSLWLVSHGITSALLTLSQGAQLVDELRAAGAYLPCNGATFPRWAHENGLAAPNDPPVDVSESPRHRNGVPPS